MYPGLDKHCCTCLFRCQEQVTYPGLDVTARHCCTNLLRRQEQVCFQLLYVGSNIPRACCNQKTLLHEPLQTARAGVLSAIK